MGTFLRRTEKNESAGTSHSGEKRRNGVSLPAVGVRPEKPVVQRQKSEEEDLPLQGKFEKSAPTANSEQTIQRTENNTGLPDHLKSGIENISGFSMDDVRVHYNSSKPANLQAHAYAQGTDIHVAPGQEKHLPHEAWHIVQQKQGRVQATMQFKQGVPVNDDTGLEQEADVMGARAASAGMTKPIATPTVASVQRVEKIIQAKSYSTTANKNRPGLTGTVDVTDGDTSITLAGTLKNALNQDVAASGTVYIPEYKVSEDRSKQPAAEKDRGWLEKKWDPSDALRVKNLTANPRGMKIGQILTYHHGLAARRKGKAHVIAMNVSDARGPFYTPLGFTDYNPDRPFQQIKTEKDAITEWLNSPGGQQLNNQEVMEWAEKRVGLVEEMSNANMIISTDDLIDNSLQQLRTIWDEL